MDRVNRYPKEEEKKKSEFSEAIFFSKKTVKIYLLLIENTSSTLPEIIRKPHHRHVKNEP